MTSSLLAAAVVTLRVLFVGNSLTFANNVPAMVEALGRANGDTIECVAVALPDFSLEDHWNHGDAARAIARGGWSVVVLQQGPSALPESRVLLNEYVRKFDQRIRAAGSKTAMFMVWPSSQRQFDFGGVSQSYAGAAKLVGGILIPVGDAWRAAWRRDAKLQFYGPDGFHPTPLGSYLAALVIYRQITGRSVAGLAPTLTSPAGAFPAIVLTPAQAALLHDAVESVTSAGPA